MPMHYFISAIPFLFLFYVPTATASVDDNDDVFLAFVKDEPNFEAVGKELEENGKLKNIGKPENGNSSTNQKEYLTQKYKAHLGVMYLMKKYWNCDKIKVEKKEIESEKTECQKFREYLDILYEYLFRVHLEAADQTLSQQLPAVKPQFEFYLHSEEIPLKTLIEIVEGLNEISGFFFDQNSSFAGCKLTEMFPYVNKTKLSNEVQLNYKLKTANPNILEKFKNLKTKISKNESAIGTFREQFDKKLEQMLKNTKKNEANETAETKSKKGKANKMGSSDKFGIFLDSPFYGKVRQ